VTNEASVVSVRQPFHMVAGFFSLSFALSVRAALPVPLKRGDPLSKQYSKYRIEILMILMGLAHGPANITALHQWHTGCFPCVPETFLKRLKLAQRVALISMNDKGDGGKGHEVLVSLTAAGEEQLLSFFRFIENIVANAKAVGLATANIDDPLMRGVLDLKQGVFDERVSVSAADLIQRRRTDIDNRDAVADDTPRS